MTLTKNKPCVGPLSFSVTHSVRWTPAIYSPKCSFASALECTGPPGRRPKFRKGKGCGKMTRPLMKAWRNHWTCIEKRSSLNNKLASVRKGLCKDLLARHSISRKLNNREHGVKVVFGKSPVTKTLDAFFSKKK